MTEEIKTRILNDIRTLTELLEQYDAATADILNTDIDLTLGEILNRREEIIELVRQSYGDIEEAGSLCTEEEQSVLTRIMKNGHVPLGIGKDLRDINKEALRMRSAFLAISDKEQKANLRVDARVKELRAELESLKDDKVKLDFYSKNRIDSSKGGSFDSSL